MLNALKILALAIALAVISVGCGGGGDSVQKVSEPKSAVATTQPVVTNQQNGPSKQDWVTLTDADEIFSIDVPSHWDTVIDTDELMAEYPSLAEQGILAAFRGVDSQTGSNAFLLLDMQELFSVEPQPIDRDGYMQSQLADLSQMASTNVSQTDVTLDGISGTQFNYSMGEEIDQIATILIGDEPRMACGSLGIALTVTSPSMDKKENTEAKLAIVEQVAASLRILSTAAIAPTCDDRKALSLLEASGDSVGATEYIGEVDGLRLIEWEAIEDDYGDLAIVGSIENISAELKEYVGIQFDVYDKSGYSLGQVEGFTERLAAGRKWRFEAISSIPVDEVGEIELFDIYNLD